LVSMASLPGAGICLLTAATRRFIMDDVVRSWSSDTCRLARSSDFWVTTEDCAQAASDAAASVTANSRMNFPARAGINGASSRVQPALTSTHEILVQPMEDMLQSSLAPQPKPKTNPRQWRDRIRAETWPDAIGHSFLSAIPFECGDCVTARPFHPRDHVSLASPRNPSTAATSRNLVHRHLVGDAAQRHASGRGLQPVGLEQRAGMRIFHHLLRHHDRA
jgi:hypothetical protein